MGLVPQFTAADITREIDGAILNIEAGIIEVLRYVGEDWVKNARENLNITGAFPKGDYTDRTSNLRSSIGFFILKDGTIIDENLQGTPTGNSAARSAIVRVPKTGYQLIGVAGMDYASHVENMGYNVITSQQDVALVDLRDMLREYQEKVNRKGAGLGYDFIGDIVTSLFR